MRAPIGVYATVHALVAWGLLVLVDNAAVRADAGDLDPSFGSGGVALADPFPPDESFATGLAPALDSDGRILVAGASNEGVPGASIGVLVRFTPSGSLDDTFSGDGQLSTFTLVLSALTVGPDAKPVVAGTDFPFSLPEFTLYRYSADGAPDASFGYLGSVTHSIPEVHPTARGVALQSDGKPIVATRFALSRFHTDGSVDTGFAGDGDLELAVEIVGGSFYGSGPVVALQPDQKIVVVGTSGTDVAVARYDSDGEIDSAFGAGGVAVADFGGTLDQGKMVAIEGGAIVVAGSTNAGGEEDFALARFDSGGSLDPSFSGDGRLTLDFGGDDEATYDLRVAADGSLRVLGYTDADVAAAGLLSDGSLDTAFGNSGTLVVDPPFNGFGGAIQPDGKLIFVGGQQSRLAAARFLIDDCSNGAVDAGEECDEGASNGASSSCCTSTCELRVAGEICRPPASACDVGESCTGSDSLCPVDTFVPDGTSCDDGDGCTIADACGAGVCSGDPDPAACLDAQLCYVARVTKGTPGFGGAGGIDLTDDLWSGELYAKKPGDLCVAAGIGGGSVVAPEIHGVGYKIRKSPGEPKYVKKFGIAVTDAFGTWTVDAIKSERLVAPAGLAQGGPAPTPAPGASDHFQCHRVRTSPGTASLPGGLQVAVQDGFFSRTYDVKSPRRLCLAAAKDGVAAVHPQAHRMCYRVALARGEPPIAPVTGSIRTADSLGSLRLDAVREDELCIPARLLP